MPVWQVTFLVTGFRVKGAPTLGRVTFSECANPGSREADWLVDSARKAGFLFSPLGLPLATSRHEASTALDAGRAALFELDRTLDTLVFTEFGRSRYLPVGYAVQTDFGGVGNALAFTETVAPVPLISTSRLPELTPTTLRWVAAFLGHSSHLLLKSPAEQSEASRALGAALRWCRLGALARGFSESRTVAFVMEWTALETLLLKGPSERVGDALKRLPILMQHWPIEVAYNYDPRLRSTTPSITRELWREVVARLYSERRDVFHGRQFYVPSDPAAPLPGDGFAHLESILGRCVAFVGQRARECESLSDVWAGVEKYVPERDDAPPQNLGGWARSYGVVR